MPEPGVEDIFEEQIADTWEVGVKGTFWGGRASGSVSAYYTDFENAYFFFFDPGTSTQNLGSIPEVTYQGVEIEGSALVTDNLSVNFGLGYTDSEIKEAAEALLDHAPTCQARVESTSMVKGPQTHRRAPSASARRATATSTPTPSA